MGCVFGYVVYLASVCFFELVVVPLLIPPGQPYRPYGGMLGFMGCLGGLLGLAFQRVLRLRQSDPERAGRVGVALGGFSLFVVVWLLASSSPRNYPLLERGNLVVFSPLALASLYLFIWSSCLALGLAGRNGIESPGDTAG